MNHELLKTAEKYHKKRQRRSVWRKALGVLGCVVVFCTTYALILPALTMEKESFCGFTQHIHEESCYGIPAAPRQGVCTAEGLGVHVHTEGCYSGGVLTCGKADFVAHLHSEDCYAADGTLWCPLPEVTTHTHGEACYTPADPGHSHGDDCYTVRRLDLLCTLEETPGHTHGQECYTVGQGELICTEAEGEAHTHGEDCYSKTQLLTCTAAEEPGHSHDDSCYALESVLSCQQEERAATEAVLTCQRCEQPLHHHSDACYSGGVLSCGKLQLESHVHGESCFVTLPVETTEPQLICGMSEHSHRLLCFSDPTADVESSAQWEATLPDSLSGTAAEDLLAVAKSQIGYKESVKNYTVLADGTTMQGYSRYGHWYGSRYGDWCAMFTAFCLHYADIPRSAMPYDANCGVWVDLLKANDQFREADGYTPVPGDIIFFDYNNSRQADHVGIVYSVDSENNKLTTIEGNHSHRVDTFRYNLSESDILGYGLLAGPGSAAAATTVSATIYTDPTCTVPAADDTVITVSGLLPAGAQARAYAVTPESPTVNGQVLLCAYDITVLDSEGQVLTQSEDGTPFTVTIRPANWPSDSGACTVYYLPDHGEPQAMDTQSGSDAVSFTTDHFSVYALAISGSEDAIYLNGITGSDSGDGLTPDTAVQTVEQAMTLVRSGGTVYITGTVTVSGEAAWDCAGSSVVFRRHDAFTGPLVTVADGGRLSLGRGVTLRGGSAAAPLVSVRDGGELVLHHGAVLTGNSNTAGNGGAVYCEGTMTMLGGAIRDCQAHSGGGICLGGSATLHLLGGTVDGNSAENGGGLYVAPESRSFLSGGSITNNTAAGSGGGIHLAGKAVLNRTVICDNRADTAGGGIAAGSGAQVFLYDKLLPDNGGALFGNTAAGAANDLSGESAGLTMAAAALGGGSCDWTQTGSSYTSSLPAAAQSAARAEAQVLLSGNSAAVGGGICCEGLLEIGGEAQESTYLTLQVLWTDEATHGDLVTVQLLQDGVPYGAPLRIHRTYDDSGKELWPAFYAGGLPLGHTYTAQQAAVPGYTVTAEQTGQSVLLTNRPAAFRVVLQWLGDTEETRPAITAVQLYRNDTPWGEAVTLSAENGWSYDWAQLPETDENGVPYVYTARQVAVPEGYYTLPDSQLYQNTQTMINRPIPLLALSAEVQWVGEGQHPDTVQVQLLCSGSPCGEAVTLSAENGWLWQWNDLGAVDSAGQAVTYTVEALPVVGYLPRVETTSRTTEEGEILHFLVINEPKDSLSVQILKYSTGTDENGDPVLLAGAELALYRLGGEVQIPGTTSRGTLLEQWTSESINGLSGGVHTMELGDGTYYLVETRAPAGHMRLAEPLVFCIEDRIVTQMPAGSLADGETLTVRVYNSLAYAMPQTGGIGTTPFTLGGLLLVFAAAILLLHHHKKQRREDIASS